MEYCAKSELYPASAGLGMLKGQCFVIHDFWIIGIEVMNHAARFEADLRE